MALKAMLERKTIVLKEPLIRMISRTELKGMPIIGLEGYDEGELTESERDQLAEFWGAYFGLIGRRKEAIEKGDFEAARALSKAIKELKEKYEFLLPKEYVP